MNIYICADIDFKYFMRVLRHLCFCTRLCGTTETLSPLCFTFYSLTVSCIPMVPIPFSSAGI
jgi:hypothetical protein